MNVLIPHLWLKDHLDTKAKPAALQKFLSLCGPAVERIDHIGQEAVYTIEITTNRVDTASVRGLAREAAAILPRFKIKAKLKPLPLPPLPVAKTKLPLAVTITNQRLCPRFSAVILDQVTIKPSPPDIQQRLTLAGLRPINNVVDISNYLMHSLGQPAHVFDYDQIAQAKMTLRLSKPGEKITTLDGKTFTLPGKDIVIEDGNHRLIDLCGIMGGANTAVTDKTKRVLLFVQVYQPQSIRRTSMSLAQRTQAATLFEKELDPENVIPTLRLGIDLFLRFAQAQVASHLIDLYPKKPKARTIKVTQAQIDTSLGIALPPPEIQAILTSLAFSVTHKNNTFLVTPPSFRIQDIQIPQDLIEEIARLYGYHRLPSRLMAGALPTAYPPDNFFLEQELKQRLVDWGFTEIYTLSLVSDQLAASVAPPDQHLRLKNPLFSELTYLRQSLLPSHLLVVKENSSQPAAKLFEVANLYLPRKNKLPQETLVLQLTTPQSFLNLKGTIEKLLASLRVNYQFIPDHNQPLLARQRQALIASRDQIIGQIGEINRQLLNQFQLPSPIAAAQFELKLLLRFSQAYPHYQPVSKYPPIIQDLTFILPLKTYTGQVSEEITSCDKLVQTANLKEVFGQSQTYTIYFHHPQKALTNEDVQPIRQKIIAHIKKHFNGKLKA